jgi:hypothetical protein
MWHWSRSFCAVLHSIIVAYSSINIPWPGSTLSHPQFYIVGFIFYPACKWLQNKKVKFNWCLCSVLFPVNTKNMKIICFIEVSACSLCSWVVTPCGCGWCCMLHLGCFRGTFYLHLQGQPLIWSQHALLKDQSISAWSNNQRTKLTLINTGFLDFVHHLEFYN